MTESIYVLLAVESYSGQDKSHEDTSAELDDIQCSLHASLETAKEAAQASFNKSLGDRLAEDEEDREMLEWHGWWSSDLYAVGYRGYEIRLLSAPSIDAE